MTFFAKTDNISVVQSGAYKPHSFAPNTYSVRLYTTEDYSFGLKRVEQVLTFVQRTYRSSWQCQLVLDIAKKFNTSTSLQNRGKQP